MAKTRKNGFASTTPIPKGTGEKVDMPIPKGAMQEKIERYDPSKDNRMATTRVTKANEKFRIPTDPPKQSEGSDTAKNSSGNES